MGQNNLAATSFLFLALISASCGFRPIREGIIPVKSCACTEITFKNGRWQIKEVGRKPFFVWREPAKISVREGNGFGKSCAELEP